MNKKVSEGSSSEDNTMVELKKIDFSISIVSAKKVQP